MFVDALPRLEDLTPESPDAPDLLAPETSLRARAEALAHAATMPEVKEVWPRAFSHAIDTVEKYLHNLASEGGKF